MQVVKLSQVYRLKKGRWYRKPKWDKGHLILAYTGTGQNRRYHILVYSEDVHASPKHRIPLSEVASELKIGPVTIQPGSPKPRPKLVHQPGPSRSLSYRPQRTKQHEFMSATRRYFSADSQKDFSTASPVTPPEISPDRPGPVLRRQSSISSSRKPEFVPGDRHDLMVSIPIKCSNTDFPEIAWILIPSEVEFLEWKRLIAGKLAEIGLKPPKNSSVSSSDSSGSSSTPSTVSLKDDQESVSSEWESFWDNTLTAI